MARNLAFLIPFVFGLTLLSCSGDSVGPKTANPPIVATDSFFVAYYDINSLPISNLFDSGKVVCAVKDLSLDELSGITTSSVANLLWGEEDSGNQNIIYLLNVTDGSTEASFRMPFDDRDWEDIAEGPGPTDGVKYLYLSETGDNNHVYPVKTVFRFQEPETSGKSSLTQTYSLPVDKIQFKYPDGIKNTEALMVDPLTKDFYLISKEDQAVIYVAKYPQYLDSVFVVDKIGTLPISTVTAADISPDGQEIIIKNYDRIFYWKRSGKQTIPELLQQRPVRLKYVPEPKGEAICWGADGEGFYTTSENPGDAVPQFFFYARK